MREAPREQLVHRIERFQKLLSEREDPRDQVRGLTLLACDIDIMRSHLNRGDTDEDVPRDLDPKLVLERFQGFKDDLGDKYHVILEEAIIEGIDRYRSGLCSLPMYLERVDGWMNEIDQELSLIENTHKLYAMSGERETAPGIVSALTVCEHTFHCQYDWYADTLVDLEVGYSYYPEEMWWRHPEAVAAGEDYFSTHRQSLEAELRDLLKDDD